MLIPAVALLAVGVLMLPAGASASELLVSNHGANTVSPFSIGVDGSLTPIACPGIDCNTGQGPIGVAISPNGQFFYTADYGQASVSAFSIGAGGSLTPIACPGCSTSTGYGPFGLAASPDGQFLYTANFGSSTVSAFSVGADGSLTPIACAANCDTGGGPIGVAVSTNGQFLYTASEGSDSVSAFSIGADGSLTPISCSGCATGFGPVGVTVTPDGRFLYATDSGSNSVSAFSIGADGSLTPITCTGCATGSDPVSAMASPAGKFLYVANRGSSTVSAFSIGADGSLTPITCSGCSTGMGPEGVAVSPGGQFVYTANHSSSVSAFSIAGDGSLTPIACAGANCHTGSGPDQESIVVTPDQAPAASFTVTPARPGQPSRFDGSSSSASPGQSVARYEWSFGDRSSATAASPSTEHTYAEPGVYTVTLTVVDNAGCSAERIFTGQTVSCNGSPAARKSERVVVSGPPTSVPVISRVRESAKRWREAKSAGRRLPLGTTFSFTLNERATITFRFTKSTPRASVAGTLVFAAHAGANTLFFDGRISRTRRLGPGRYTLVITARNAGGHRSASRSLRFVIVG